MMNSTGRKIEIVDRTTAATVWAFVGKRGASAHAMKPQGQGWASECGRFVNEQPTPAPDTAKRCTQCEGLTIGTWRGKTEIPRNGFQDGR